MTVEVEQGESSRQDLLLTSVGKSRYALARYVHRDREDAENEVEVRFAFLATAHLVARPTRILVLATREAWAWAHDAAQGTPTLADEALALGLPTPELLEIPLARDQDDLTAILQTIREGIGPGSRVHLDVTLALRHLPLLFLGGLTVLRETRQIELASVHYAAFEAKDEQGRAPVLDLTAMVELSDWFAACRRLRELGDGRPLAQLLDSTHRRVYQARGERTALQKLSRFLTETSAMIGAGLPLELQSRAMPGKARACLLDEVARLAPAAVDLVEPALDDLAEVVGPWGERGPTNKKNLPLTLELCRRQLRLAQQLFARGDFSGATKVAREAAVDRLILWRGGGAPGTWLERDDRRQGELDFGEHAARGTGRVSKALGSLRNSRNELAHAGHKHDNVTVDPAPSGIATAVSVLLETLEDDEAWRPPERLPGAIWVSPVGLSRGLIYTLLTRSESAGLPPECAPGEVRKLILLTSAAARPGAEEALREAGWDPGDSERVRWCLVEDPFAGFEEAQKLVKSLKPDLEGCRALAANLTGGTTVLQLIVERVRRFAASEGAATTTVACVDRRSAEEQQADPYGAGEVLCLGDLDRLPGPTEAEGGRGGVEEGGLEA